jgi:hypothetical protein
MREDTQGPPVFFLIYYDIFDKFFLKKKSLRKWVKDSSICGMSVDLPGAASQGAVAFLQPIDIGCGRHFSVFVSVSFPLAHPTDTLCPLYKSYFKTPTPRH